MRRFVPWICLLLVFLPLTVTSTPPARPPLNSYRLSGRLVTSLGTPIAGAPVAFAAHCRGELVVLNAANVCACSQGNEPGHPSDRTAPDGTFSLDLVSCERFDSLAVAVVGPNPVVKSKAYAVQDARREDWNRPVPNEGTGYFFCATSTTGFSNVQVGSIYSFAEQTVTLSPSSGR